MNDLTKYLKGLLRAPTLWLFDPNNTVLGVRIVFWCIGVLLIAFPIMALNCRPILPLTLLIVALFVINYGRGRATRKLWFNGLQLRLWPRHELEDKIKEIEIRRSEIGKQQKG